MDVKSLDADAFDAFEASGWEAKALRYSAFLASITRRVSEQLLNAAAVTRGSRVLDVGTGPGHIAAQSADRGATVVAVDVAEAMVELARRLHPGLDVRLANAYALPFKTGSFDVVVGNFVILHLGRPERAAAEFARVLAPGGVLALTTWDTGARARFPGILVDAVAEAVTSPPRDIPTGPDFFRFSVPSEFARLFRSCGLEESQIETIAFPLRVNSAEELWDGLLEGTVRASALVSAQPDETQQRIRVAFDRLIDRYRHADVFELPVSVKLAVARKPA